MSLKYLRVTVTIFFINFVISFVFSQTINDDNIEFLRVKNQKEQGNYRKALNILFNNISDQNKSNSIYLSYTAECYEKLGIYDSAVIYYYKLYSQNQSYDVMQKIAELKDKEEESKDKAKELALKKEEDLKKEEIKKKNEKIQLEKIAYCKSIPYYKFGFSNLTDWPVILTVIYTPNGCDTIKNQILETHTINPGSGYKHELLILKVAQNSKMYYKVRTSDNIIKWNGTFTNSEFNIDNLYTVSINPITTTDKFINQDDKYLAQKINIEVK